MDDDAAYAAVKAGEVDIASIPGSFAKEEIEGKELKYADLKILVFNSTFVKHVSWLPDTISLLVKWE